MVQTIILDTVTAATADLAISNGQIRITSPTSGLTMILQPVDIFSRGTQKYAYNAGTARVTTYTLVSGTIVANTTYTIIIAGKSYPYVVGATVPTSTVLCTAIAGLINADPQAPCTATSGATTVVLTGIASTGNWLFTSIADTAVWTNSVGTAGTAGVNTPSQIYQRYGITTTNLYTSYEIIQKTQNPDLSAQNVRPNLDQYNILIKSDATNATALITAIDNTFNGLDIATGLVAEPKLIEVSRN